ncbi:hypothetical protein [Nocardioides sp. CF8]|uniref:hypothetical protein n=1 Tax=Nocardioides sp. CF8 TaxID=110319 RepID=UPI0004158823|nr:hypothetical protein [Nocardioides sp. CF8]
MKSQLFFDDVRVPASNLLGTEEGQGFIQLMMQLPRERLLVTISCAASMNLMLDITHE